MSPHRVDGGARRCFRPSMSIIIVADDNIAYAHEERHGSMAAPEKRKNDKLQPDFAGKNTFTARVRKKTGSRARSARVSVFF